MMGCGVSWGGRGVKMPFGKHKGLDLHDVPDSYLLWVLGNVETLSPILRGCIERHLGVEETADPPRDPWHVRTPGGADAPPKPTLAAIEEVVSTMRRRYASANHPDRGGSLEAMQAVNGLCDDIIAAIRGRLG